MTPVRFLTGATAGHRCYLPGEVAGVSDMDARRLIRQKKAVPVEQATAPKSTPAPVSVEEEAKSFQPSAERFPKKPKTKFWKR